MRSQLQKLPVALLSTESKLLGVLFTQASALSTVLLSQLRNLYIATLGGCHKV